MKKKISLIVLVVALLLVALVLGFRVAQQWQNRQITDFIAKKEKTKITDQPLVIQSGNIGDHYVSAFIPTDEQGQVFPFVKEQMEAYIKTHIGTKEPAGVIKQLVFVSLVEDTSTFSNVKARKIVSESYPVEFFSIGSAKELASQSLLLTNDYQLFTLEKLFTDTEKARSLFATALQKELLAQGIAEADVTQQIKRFEAKDLASSVFKYDKSQLSLLFSDKEFGVSTLTLPISDFYAVIDSIYLSAEDKVDYDTYKAEEEAKKQQKRIALTFDDGPSAITTPQVLDILKKYNIKATFFMLGQNVAGNEELVKRVIKEGHEIGSHTWDHQNLVTISTDEVRREIEQTQDVIKSVTGQAPTMMRPPYGSVNQSVMDTMKLPVIYWSVDSEDWKSRNASAILGQVKTYTYPGSIILMHDIHQPTVDSLTSVIEYLLSEGYTLVTVSDLLGTQLNPQLIYYDQHSAGPAQ